MTTSTSDRTVTERLYGWVTFEEGATAILAILFGQMVKRAAPVVHEFHSDLFHDAEWLRQHVTGETTFDWVVRHSGTNIAESARVQWRISPSDDSIVFYRIRLWAKDGKDWHATFTRLTREEALS